MLLILIPIFPACNSRGTVHNKVENNIDNPEYNEDPNIEYVTLSNGAKVDARIPEGGLKIIVKNNKNKENIYYFPYY